MLSKAIYTILSTNAGVSALIGTRIYPLKIPSNPTYPLITYQLISQPQVHTMDNKHYSNSRMQVDAWATTFLSGQGLGDAIDSALNGYKGIVTSQENIHSCLQISREDYHEEGTEDYRVSFDYSIWHVPV
jgi:hypothetical protein